MAETISIDLLKKRLKDIFCLENKTSKKYSEIWLSDVDFGGLYQTDRVIVNVKAEHEIESCNEEIKYIVTELFKQLTKEELSLIWRVVVYNYYEEIHCESDDLLVYNTIESCK